MNFAAARPLGLPRVLAPPTEEAPKAKTPTPEPFDSETRKVSFHPCCTDLTTAQTGSLTRGFKSAGPALLPAAGGQVLPDHSVEPGGWGGSSAS